MFRYYHGEKNNPFDHDLENTSYMFWFYESVFQSQFDEWDSSGRYAFFGKNELGNRFMKLITDLDHERPTEMIKKALFEIWLDYLFTDKLYPEYGGPNYYKAWYYGTATA